MPIKEPTCHYYQIFDEKRKGVKLTYDFSLTIGFQSNTRWEDPKDPSEFIEFGIKRGDLHLELINGEVDLEEGDKLGGSLELTTKKKTLNAEKTADTEFGTGVEITASLTPSLKIGDGGGDEHKTETHRKTVSDSIHLTISSNFGQREQPFWIFKADDKHLDGSMTTMPLCAVKGLPKTPFSYESKFVVQPHDVDITYKPKKWTDALPFKGLLTRKLELRIADVMSDRGKHQKGQSVKTV